MHSRSVVITGTSSGFGLHTALAFARRGHRVFATMRDPLRSEQLCDAAASEELTLEVVPLDVADDVSVAEAVSTVLARAGRIDVVVNNAGTGARGAIETFPDRVVRHVFEINLFGAWRVARAVLPHMRRQQSGSIVNVSSVTGLVPVPFNGLYSASKHALEAMTEALALEVEPFGIRVALVEPSYYRTNLGTAVEAATVLDPSSPYADDETRALRSAVKSVSRGGDPAEVADTIVDAAMSADRRLRWVVGTGALETVQRRRDSSEEEWTTWARSSWIPWRAHIE